MYGDLNGVVVVCTSSSFHSSQNEEAMSLYSPLSQLDDCPVFEVNASDVTLLHSPTAFYDALLAGTRRARRRVVLSALYFGTRKPLERQLLTALSDAASNLEGPDVLLLLDCLRSTRPMKVKSPIDDTSADHAMQMASTFTYADDIATALFRARDEGDGFSRTRREKVRVSLFHTPLLSGFLKNVLIPRRFDEIAGVQHMKCTRERERGAVLTSNIR